LRTRETVGLDTFARRAMSSMFTGIARAPRVLRCFANKLLPIALA